MLTTWLIEIYLNDLGCLSDEGDKDGYSKLQTEFYRFLQQKSLRECLEVNRKTVYGLISSHGAVEVLVFFATLMKGICMMYIVHCMRVLVADFREEWIIIFVFE